MVRMNRKKVVLGLLFIVIITSSFFIDGVKAWSSTSISNYDVTKSFTVLQNQVVEAGSNKMFFLKPYESGNARLKLEVYDSLNGGLLQEKTLTDSDLTGSGSSPYPFVWGAVLFVYEDSVGIFAPYWDGSGNEHMKVFIYDYTSNSFTDSNRINLGDIYECYCLFSNRVVQYDDDYFAFATTRGDNFMVFKYEPDTNTLSRITNKDLGGGSSSDFCMPLIVQDDSNKQIVIAGFSAIDEEYPRYYKIDLSDGSDSHLADHPITSDRLNYDSFTSGGARDEVVQTYDKQIGGEVVYNGSQVWVVFTWITSYVSSSPTIRPIQHRLVFNESISSANLLGQNERTYTVQPNTVGNNTIWCEGYMNERDEYYIFYPINVGGTDMIYQEHVVITDWWNYGTTGQDVSSSAESIEFPNSDNADWVEDDLIYRNWEGSWLAVLDESDSCQSGWLYYGGEPTIAEYDLFMSYSPEDSPLIQDKIYEFEVFATVNEIGTSKLLIIYIDDVQHYLGYSGSNGLLTFDFASGYIGTRSMEVKMLSDLGVLLHNETFSYTFIESTISDEPTQDILIPRATTYLVAVLPTLIMVAFPTVALGVAGADIGGSIGGSIGLLTGLSIGVGMSALTGFLPTYMIYLLILIISVAVVMIVRGR